MSIKIAQISPIEESVPPKKYGGTERIVAALCNGLVKKGVEVTLFASKDSKTVANLFPLVSKSLRKIKECQDQKIREVYKYLAMIETSKAVLDNKFDLIHNHTNWRFLPFSSFIKTQILSTLHGPLNIAYQKLVYKKFKDIFYGVPFDKQRSRGLAIQRIVWGSTGTKNPKYSDTLYVDEIIGPDTINTLPMNTLEAFLDHGKVDLTLERDLNEAQQTVANLSMFGIDLNELTDQLQKEGVQAFVKAYDQLIDSLRVKCQIS